MPANELVLRVIRGWVQKAENDLQNAVHTPLRLGEQCPADTVCFHAQQCVEKYLKAVLVSRGTETPRTHDIGVLIGLLPRKLRPEISVEEQERLTAYATTMRYPGEYETVSLQQARKAVRVARRVRKALRSALGNEALPRRKSRSDR